MSAAKEGAGARLASRARRLEVSPTVAMAARARALRATGVRVLDFTVGEPDQPTPGHVVQAGKAAIDAGRTKYAPASGLPELRAAVAQRYREDFSVSFAPEEVCIAVGGKQALSLLYQAVLDRGSEVVVPVPAWPTFAEAARVAGALPVFVPLREQNGFRPTAAAIARKITPRTRAVVVNSPSNPTGAVIEPDELLKVARLARRHGFWLLYDDTYAHLVFRQGGPPALQGVKDAAGGNLAVYKVKQIGHWQWHYSWLPGKRAYVYDGGLSRNDLRALYEADTTMSFLMPRDAAPHASYTVRFTANSWRERVLKVAGDCWYYELFFELVQVS